MSPPGNVAQPRSAAAPSASVSPRILVVEDDLDAAGVLALMIRLWGYEVRVAHDAGEALAISAQFECDLIIIDIGLPLIDGYAVGAQLRQRTGRPGPVLIALTGFGGEEDRQRAIRAGFDLFLVKPVSPDQLRTLLADVCRRKLPVS